MSLTLTQSLAARISELDHRTVMASSVSQLGKIVLTSLAHTVAWGLW